MDTEPNDPIRTFFDAYAQAFNISDTATIAASFADTFMMTSAEGARANQNGPQFQERLKQAAGFYQKIGMHTARIESYSDKPLDPHHSLVEIQWGLLREDGTDLVKFDVSYLVRRGTDGPRIVLFIPHNETENMRARGLLPS